MRLALRLREPRIPVDGKTEAQARTNAITGLWQELQRLCEEGLLALGEALLRARHDGLLQQFASRFDIDRSAQAGQLSLGMRIASFLGALALAASVNVLLLRFWGLLSTPVQVIALLTAAIGRRGLMAADGRARCFRLFHQAGDAARLRPFRAEHRRLTTLLTPAGQRA